MTTAATATPNITYRANTALAAELRARGDSLSATSLRDLTRYYALLADTLREINLSRNEWNYLRAILNGSLLDADTARHLWAEVEDAEPETADMWGIDPADLSGRLRHLPAAALLAIADAVERWWREPATA